MSRLDQHVQAIRNRFLLQGLFNHLAQLLLWVSCVLIVVVLLTRVLAVALPAKAAWAAGIFAGTFLASWIMANIRQPSLLATAMKIDDRLGLKERYSTALSSRGESDPFARAAVLDAEKTADSVSLSHRFPYHFPRLGYWTLGAILALVAVDQLVPQMDLFGREQKRQQQAAMQQKNDLAAMKVKEALTQINSIPQMAGNEKALASARKDLESLLSRPIKDPTEATRTAQKALQEAETLSKKLHDTQKIADAKEQAKTFKAMADKADGALADVKKEMADGEFSKAAAKLKNQVDQFNNADAAGREKMANDMQQMANQLKQLANDPALQEKIRQQLEKSGASKDQARDMLNEMQKAAAGDKDAADRLKNMADNLARRMNGGMIPAPEQLAPLMQQIEKMQGQLNAQQKTEQLSQAAQQMADAMKQQANNGGKSGSQQGQAGKNQQPGGQNPDPMADAQSAMQDAMSQLEAMQQDAEMAQADGGQGEGKGNGQGKWGENPNPGGEGGKGQGNGPAGWNQGGQAMGDRNYKTPAPFGTKKELSPGEKDEKGRRLAGWFVKADSVKGESKEELKQVITASNREATDDMDMERIPMQSQKVVRDYFDSMQRDAGK